MKERRLGKGLDVLIGDDQTPAATVPTDEASATVVRQIDVDLIRPNAYQPRESIDDESLHGLIDSIQRDGILQPIVVRRKGETFEIIAGERRWRASKKAGLTAVPCLITQKEDKEMLKLALVENIQREDLNPIEKARGFKAMIEKNKLTQDDAAMLLGMNRSTIANFIRLLDLQPEVRDAVSRGTISMGHARALLSINSNRQLQLNLLGRIVKEDLSVRDIEGMLSVQQPNKSAKKKSDIDNYTIELNNKLSAHLGTKAFIKQKSKGGTLVVEYYSNDQLRLLFEKLGFTP